VKIVTKFVGSGLLGTIDRKKSLNHQKFEGDLCQLNLPVLQARIKIGMEPRMAYLIFIESFAVHNTSL